MSTKWTFLKCANLTQTKGQDFVELDNYREGFSSEVFEIVQRIANSIFKRRKLQLTVSLFGLTQNEIFVLLILQCKARFGSFRNALFTVARLAPLGN